MFVRKPAPDKQGAACFRRPQWGWTHGFLRWPLFLIACLLVAVVLALYFSIRAMIHCSEWLLASSATRRARLAMERARNFEGYQAGAAALDEANDLNAWKARPCSRLYASQIVAAALTELREARIAADWPRLLRALQQSLREVNFGGHLTEALYSRSFTGTKSLVEDYCEVLVSGLSAVREEALARAAAADFDLDTARAEAVGYKLSLKDARRFAEFANCTFGRSSLCLSGGGAMAFQHFGVIDELLHRGILPKVISGTSGGAAVATYVCCRTDDELLGKAARPDLGDGYPLRLEPDEIQPSLTIWGGTWLERLQHYLRHGCLFEREPVERWAEKWALGNTTFLEAYLRTGRVLNITCSIMAREGTQMPLLLNYQTHPHVLVSSAVICSGSMPSLLNPSKLLEKCPSTGKIQAHCKHETLYADGSIDMDIPSLVLAQAFSVRYTIAVQVNPHVIPFNFAPHGEAGRPISWIGLKGRWRGGFVLCALELVLKESFRTSWKVMGLLELLPQYCGTKWNMFFSQVYEGSVTLSNDRDYLWKAMHALTNPSREQFRYWWRQGQVMTWEKMPLLEKRLRVEDALFRLVDLLDAASIASPAIASAATDSSPAAVSAITPNGLSVERRRSFILE